MGPTGKRNSTMKHRIKGLLVGAAGLFSAAFFALSGASCSQPPINCVVGHGGVFGDAPYWAKYTKITGDDNCYPKVGEGIGMATYLANEGGKANYQDRSISIVSQTMDDLFDEYTGLPSAADPNVPAISDADVFFVYGDYTNLPDGNNICYAGGNGVTALSEAEIDVPESDTGEVDPMTMMPILLPAKHYKQRFKNVKIYVTAEIPAQQVVGLMEFEDLTKGCSATYSFVALGPSVPCEGTDAAGNPKADNDLCLSEADPEHGRVFGSGINPSFKTFCDPDTMHCLLADEGAYLTGRPQ
jgi:hypothetical protein